MLQFESNNEDFNRSLNSAKSLLAGVRRKLPSNQLAECKADLKSAKSAIETLDNTVSISDR
jgi:hypothetical protein